MSACRPPFSHAWIGEVVHHRSFDCVPERFVQGTVTIINEHSLGVSRKAREESAEPKLLCRIQPLERLDPAQKYLCKLPAFLRRLNEVAPLRRQNIDPRPPPFLILLSDLD